MNQIYNINFVPNSENKKIISSLRKEICKKCFTTQALQYPVHLSLAGGSEIKDYDKFEKELLKLCKELKPFKIFSSENNTTINSSNYWTGLSFHNSKELSELQMKVEKLKNKYSKNYYNLNFIPHITLAYPAKVDKLELSKNPIKELMLNKITICKKDTKRNKYKIHKHYKLG